jgi:hypothetical protein
MMIGWPAKNAKKMQMALDGEDHPATQSRLRACDARYRPHLSECGAFGGAVV